MSPAQLEALKRLVKRSQLDPRLRDQRVHCVVCSEPLSYFYGSIAWECAERHLCPSCAANEAVERIFAEIFEGQP